MRPEEGANPQSPTHVRVRQRRNALLPNSHELLTLRAFAAVYHERKNLVIDESLRHEVTRRLERGGQDGGDEVPESDGPETETGGPETEAGGS
eukprot:CAMPEP_0182498042 /NCGR_PEP_ID=MMETSP1321-20130603/6376_1 /TAXON_ID=91990 /ORGANISM="Bolidomonas sp., Strain RCC1657" /LENGTH=92 /DNA_ID=CAMNT_0024702047 /DNA_START=177 /DNA_END=455 /DNA_ORIENTATION=+